MDPSELLAIFYSYGIGGILLLAFLEKLAPIVPSYLVLILIGMAGSDPSSLISAIAATVAGSVAGSVAWYALGRVLGPERVLTAVHHYGRYFFLRMDTYRKLVVFFSRNHFSMTFFGQLIPVVRIYLALPAGIFQFRVTPFIVAATLGSVIYNGIFLLLGYTLRGASEDLTVLGTWILAILVAFEVAFFFIAKRLLWVDRSVTQARP